MGLARTGIAGCALLAVAACSTAPRQDIAARPAAPAAPRAQPVVPAHIDIGYKLPPVAADGRFVTPNTDIGPLEAMFHFRAALNVAALLCTTPGKTAAREGYNAFLKRHRSVLANANRAVDAKYQRLHGAAEGMRVRDRKLTSLYNFFAYPPVKPQFCVQAARHLTAANTLASTQLEPFAQSALAEIEQLFQSYFAEVRRYQTMVSSGEIAAR